MTQEELKIKLKLLGFKRTYLDEHAFRKGRLIVNTKKPIIVSLGSAAVTTPDDLQACYNYVLDLIRKGAGQ